MSYFTIEDDERRLLAKERLTVSAIGGLVNFAEPGAVFARGNAGWEALDEGGGLKYGDRVRTGGSGRIEILLYPTCYLHLSNDAEIIYSERQGGGVAVKLLKGSAVVTDISDGQDEAPVTLVAPRAEYEITKEGIYRLNVTQGERSEMIVYEGQITSEGTKIKDGKKSVSQGEGSAAVSIDKKALDSFDVWSRKRTASLSASAEWVRRRIANFTRDRVFYNGLWFFDNALGSYTFVPGIWDFSSPYGGQYSVKFRAKR